MTDPSPTLFRHRFENVADYLHHRPPYLLIDQVVQIDDQAIQTQTTVAEDAFFVQGHFPGAAVVPGAILHEMTTQTAGILIAANFNPMQCFNTHDPHANEMALGVLVKTKFARYRGFARPSDVLSIRVNIIEQVEQTFDFAGEVICREKIICSNRFQLTNLSSDVLRGK